MKDIFEQEIEQGDIIAYARRKGARQIISFGVVLSIDVERKLRPILVHSAEYAGLNIYKLNDIGYRSYISRQQIWVVKDRKVLPTELVKTLEDALENYGIKQEKKKNKKKKINPYFNKELYNKIKEEIKIV